MIEIRDLTVRYGALTALDKLTLNLQPGEVFGFIGPNGAGKSTTMKVLACLLAPTSGTAMVDGFSVLRDADRIRRLVGYMPDFLGVYDDLTVDEYLQFFAAAFRIPRQGRRKLIDNLLELTDLTEKKHAMVDSLSRGMQQRLGVARVLVHDPKVLLLDEPASGLDPRARIEMRSLLLELQKMGKTIMISSHILSELHEMCSTIGIIERGVLLFAGSIDEAFQRAGATEQLAIRLEARHADAAESLRADDRIAAVDEQGAELIVELGAGQRGHHFVIERLIAGGYRIDSFSTRHMKLEDVFLRLTQGKVQ